MNSESLLNEIFFPRPSFLSKDKKDHLVEVEDGIHVSARFNMSNEKNPTILFFHGNAELSQEYDEIAYRFNQSN